jgi:carboxyl-terminal processing protease
MKKNIALAVLLVLLLANLLARDEDLWNQEVDKFSSLLTLIEKNYYRDVEPEKLVYSSIRGMLETLDPHSYFLDPDSFSRMREEYTGKYYGLGIQISKQEDNLVVVSPIEGTPASRLGSRSRASRRCRSSAALKGQKSPSLSSGKAWRRRSS